MCQPWMSRLFCRVRPLSHYIWRVISLVLYWWHKCFYFSSYQPDTFDKLPGVLAPFATLTEPVESSLMKLTQYLFLSLILSHLSLLRQDDQRNPLAGLQMKLEISSRSAGKRNVRGENLNWKLFISHGAIYLFISMFLMLLKQHISLDWYAVLNNSRFFCR